MSTDKSNPTTVKYPEGTPEYAVYRAALKAELAKFSAMEPPYDNFDFDCF